MSNSNHRIPQAAPAARTAEIEKEVRRVTRKFPTADARQVLRLAKARTAVAAIENQPLLHDDAIDIGELRIAKKAVEMNPLTIATIGQSGRGKSTLNAALIGRSDMHPNASGKPLTACITRTFLDIDPESDEAEYAVLQMRTAAELRARAEEQLRTLGIDGFRMPTDIEDLPAEIAALGLEDLPAEIAVLLEVIEQFIRHNDLITTGPGEYRRIPLDSQSGLQRLHAILREDSPENQNPERIVDLVKSIDIHLYRPAHHEADDSRLKLPDSCLVDTAGTGGSTLHKWGLQELIAEGNLDIVLFCINPRRVTETEFELARALNEAIRSRVLHPQQLLLIHNAIDEEVHHAETETAISELMRVLGGGKEMSDLHETSALSALWALEALNGKPIPNPEKYASMAVALGIDPEDVDLDAPEIHKAIYTHSGLPKLIQAINAVTHAYTVENRVTTAETSVENTITRLSHHYTAEHEQLAEELDKHGNADFESVQLLAKKQAEAYAYIGRKRASLLEPDPDDPEILQTLLSDASETLYTSLGEALPQLWDDNLVPDRLRTAPTPLLQRPLPRSFISDTEEWVWQELDLKPIGHYFAERIETAFGEQACKELLNFGFDTPISADVMSVEAVREITRAVGADITDFAAKAGKAMLGKPNYRLIPADHSTDTPSAVVQLLETIANTRDRDRDREADAEHFQALLEEIRSCYDPGIHEAVASIRGFHEAKLADIERDFGDLIFKTFITLQDHRNSDTLIATLFAEVDAEIQTLHLQKQSLDAKRTHLKGIEILMTETDAPETDGSET